MPANNKVTVITRFNPRQVGYLDFQYRIAALQKAGLLDVVISNIPQAKQELGVADDEFVHIEGGIGGPLVQWKYYYKVRKYCTENNKDRVLLLHSSLAPLASMLKHGKSFLYWNEHPSHFVGNENKKSGLFARAKDRFILKQFYKGARDADIVMPIGEQHCLDLINAGCKRDSLHMIYMGVAESFRSLSENKEDNETIRLIYTGSVKRDRGRDIMLEAIALLKAQGKHVYLDIVGASTEELAICNKRCIELNIDDRVEIIGRVPGSEIPGYIEKADIGICIWADKPYWRFNPPTKLFEYLVAGLPVLANNMVTHTEYVKDGINGLICEYDAESMASVISRCIDNSIMLGEMKKYVKQYSDEYLWSNIEPGFIQLIQS